MTNRELCEGAEEVTYSEYRSLTDDEMSGYLSVIGLHSLGWNPNSSDRRMLPKARKFYHRLGGRAAYMPLFHVDDIKRVESENPGWFTEVVERRNGRGMCPLCGHTEAARG